MSTEKMQKSTNIHFMIKFIFNFNFKQFLMNENRLKASMFGTEKAEMTETVF